MVTGLKPPSWQANSPRPCQGGFHPLDKEGSVMSGPDKIPHAEFLELAKARFGPDPINWAFRCPGCGDVATGLDFREALAAHPHTNPDGTPTTASDLLGQECIGRVVGALKGPAGTPGGRGEAARGCDWCSYGLIRGPWEIVMPDGHSAWSFPLAEVVKAGAL